MKLNSTDRYLSLCIKALENGVKTCVDSPDAASDLGFVVSTLQALLKREQQAPEVLRTTIAEGSALLGEISEFLGQSIGEFKEEPGNHPSDCAEHEQATGKRFDALIEQHASLTEHLTSACRTLAESEAVSGADQAAALLRRAAEWECSYYADNTPLTALDVVETTGSSLTQESFERFLNAGCAEFKSPVSVESFRAMPGGFGKETYFCSFVDAEGEHAEVVIRKNSPTPIMNFGACNLDNEFALLQALPETYPAPKPLAYSESWEDVDGAFYIMPRSPGSVPGGFLQGVADEIAEETLLELAKLLAKLHSTPLDSFSDYAARYDNPAVVNGTIEDAYRFNLEAWEKHIEDEAYLASPLIVWLVHWLKSNIPRDERAPILVHGDFNIHNVLVENARISAVLDWECAGFGAPEQDLAYIQPHVSQHIEWQRFVDHYQAAGGHQLREENMRFGVAYAALRTNLAGNRGTENLQRGVNEEIRYAMVELGFTPTFMGMALNSAIPGSDQSLEK